MNAFHVLGGLLAFWALLVSFLGITRENFPATKQVERAVAAISVTLVAAAISSAIITAIHEEKKEKDEEQHKAAEKAAWVLPVR